MWPARLFGPPPALFFAGIPQQIQALRTLPIGAQVALLSLREGYLIPDVAFGDPIGKTGITSRGWTMSFVEFEKTQIEPPERQP